MNRIYSFPIVPFLTMAFISGLALADPGHDHGKEATATTSVPTLARFEAHSEVFEVVGVLNSHELSVFVDRYTDNAPVLKANVELESGKTNAVGRFHEDHGDYGFDAAAFQKPGTYPISLTVTSGDDVDIVAGNLVVSDSEAVHAHADSASSFKRAGLWALSLLALIVSIGLARRFAKRRSVGVQ